MKKFIVVILVSLAIMTSAGPASLNDDDLTDRLSDIGMHPHMNRHSHAGHSKVKRSTESKINQAEFSSKYWINQAKELIKNKVNLKRGTKKAKNVILFLGDGLSHPSVAAARIFQAGESSKLSFETFPFTASSKTYCVDRTVADSACSGTAFLHGVKTNYGMIGLNAKAQRTSCNDTNNEALQTSSIASWFLDDDRSAGIVTTTRITDATPAAVYASISERDWEGNQQVTDSGCDHTNIYDLAEQLVRGSVGSRLKVILGGGSKNFINSTEKLHGSNGLRTDGKNLIKDWLNLKSKRTFVGNREELMHVNPDKVKQLLGLFHADHMPYHLETVQKNQQSLYPTLAEMAVKAVEILSEDDDGYFLLVEGGRIDHGHHANQAKFAIDEVLEFSKAIQAVLEKVDLDETLLIATADHSHVMTVAGYSQRGTDIFSAPKKANDEMPYFTLSYANGPGYSTHTVNGKRADPQTLDASPIDFVFPATVPHNKDTHAGEDVGIWATGVNAHIFKGAMEQNVIPHVLAYASCVGNGLKVCD